MLRFGGAGHVAPLHALGQPFTDADGPRVLADMRFDQVCVRVLGLLHWARRARSALHPGVFCAKV